MVRSLLWFMSLSQVKLNLYAHQLSRLIWWDVESDEEWSKSEGELKKL